MDSEKGEKGEIGLYKMHNVEVYVCMIRMCHHRECVNDSSGGKSNSANQGHNGYNTAYDLTSRHLNYFPLTVKLLPMTSLLH